MLKPHMRIFCVPQNASIAFRVGFSYGLPKMLKPYMHPFGVAQIVSITFRVGLFQSDFACAYCI
jgi:hypothetical protein